MAAAGKPLVTLGGKGSSLTSASVFDVANGLARVAIDDAAQRLSSSASSDSHLSFSIPSYLKIEEKRASLLLLLKKILASSSDSASAHLIEIIEGGIISCDHSLDGVALGGSSAIDYPAAAVDGVSALLDHGISCLTSIVDAVAAMSCEALGADVAAFNLTDSGDGSTPKDAVAVAADFKVFFRGSKSVGSGNKLSVVAKIPLVHGCLREISRLFHSKTRVQLNSGFRDGSTEDMSAALPSLAVCLSNLADISILRTKIIIEDSFSNEKLRSSLSEALVSKCPGEDALQELCSSYQAALRNKDYLSFVHNVYELLNLVRKVVSWEAVAAFVSLEGDELFRENFANDNGNVGEPSRRVNSNADKKNEKKKKIVWGKGTTVLMQFLKDKLFAGGANLDLNQCAESFLSLLDPMSLGFGDLLMIVKEIVERNESQRKPKLPKGTRDFAKEQMTIRERAFSIIVKVFKRHGATALDTPVFELRETLTGKYGEDSKLIYHLEDQGGELCSLRYDLTVPFARYVGMNGSNPLKRYQIAKVYRRDNPAKGRFREFYQCDFDIAGHFEKMGPDFEVIKIATELLDELDIGDYEVKLNHRKLLDGMLAICAVPQEKFRTICSSIDKLDKLAFEQVKKEMVEEKGLTEESANRIGTYVKLRGSPVELLSRLKQEGSEFVTNRESVIALNELDILFQALSKAKCIHRVVFDLSLARGLDYYTGMIFEVVFKGWDTEEEATAATKVGSIAAGGRYDNLIGMFGKDLPAVGISLGIERVFTIMEQQNKNQEIRATETQVLVSVRGDNLSIAAELVSELWDANVESEYMVNKRYQKHMDRARESKIPYMVLVQDDQLSKGIVKIKDFAAATEEEVQRNEVVPEIQRRLGRAR